MAGGGEVVTQTFWSGRGDVVVRWDCVYFHMIWLWQPVEDPGGPYIQESLFVGG